MYWLYFYFGFLYFFFFFFFFQAEDGIRDDLVTGVQTCALPISACSMAELPWNKRAEESLDLKRAAEILEQDHHGLKDVRSEERRVGKECRSRWGRDH